MNLDPILDFGEFGALNVEIGGSDEQAKFGFSLTACRAKLKKKKKNHILLDSDHNCLVLVLKLKPQISSFWKN